MRLTRDDGMLSTGEAARLVGVKPVTIRQWRSRGWLDKQGLDERNRPLHTPEAVRAAERLVRENGRRTSGIDPRQLRGRRATPHDLQQVA
jgi:DNA-binding transcriptional MerR regulator